MVLAMAEETELSSATLTFSKSAPEPRLLATSCPAVSLRSKMATRPPFSAMACATARPIPEAPPVITTPAAAIFISSTPSPLISLFIKTIHMIYNVMYRYQGCSHPGQSSVSSRDEISTRLKDPPPLRIRRHYLSLAHVRAGSGCRNIGPAARFLAKANPAVLDQYPCPSRTSAVVHIDGAFRVASSAPAAAAYGKHWYGFAPRRGIDALRAVCPAVCHAHCRNHHVYLSRPRL